MSEAHKHKKVLSNSRGSVSRVKSESKAEKYLRQGKDDDGLTESTAASDIESSSDKRVTISEDASVKYIPSISIASVTSTATSRRNSGAGTVGTKPILSPTATGAAAAAAALATGPLSPHDPVLTQSLINSAKLDKAKTELFEWTKSELKGYKSVTVTGLESLGDGVVFLALINCIDSTIIDFEDFDKTDKRRTLEAAFSIAEEFLRIPNLLDYDNVISGKDQKATLLYLSMFKQKIDEKRQKDNPLSVTKGLISEFKDQVKSRTETIKALSAEFEEQLLRVAALSSKDEFESEKQFYLQRAESMDRMLEETRLLVSRQEQRNELLRQQTALLQDKINALEKTIDAERLEAESALEETIRAMESASEEERASYCTQHKATVEQLRAKRALAAAASATSRRGTVSLGPAPLTPHNPPK